MDDTLSFHQLDDVKFLRYMAGCKAYATTAGFESVCEAMYPALYREGRKRGCPKSVTAPFAIVYFGKK